VKTFEDDGFALIDPPVNALSPPEEIEAWIAELKAYPQSAERDRYIERAEWELAEARGEHDGIVDD